MVYRVFGNTYLNPDAVGKLHLEVDFKDEVRTTTTRVFDTTGQHELMVATTTVATDQLSQDRDPIAVRRDNELHAQIRHALRERRDAATWEEIDNAFR